jgi:hypothetical protein
MTDLLTPREYADYRRCSVRTLDRERAEGRGCPYVRLGGRILYRRADIDRHMEAQVRGGEERGREDRGDTGEAGGPCSAAGSIAASDTARAFAEGPKKAKHRAGASRQ